MPSIYRPKVPSDAQPQQESGAPARGDAPATPAAGPDAASVWAGRRKAQPVSTLLPAAQRWLDAVPAEVRPVALATQFPRIVNLLAVNWNNPRDCSAFIASLLHDQRGGRQGFPPAVARDIRNLRVYYAALHPIVDWSSTDAHSDFWKPSGPKR